ncbi:MAG: ribosome maturation factor RimP, partial [Candidatus Omnitrophica bacterium]|nr:ribosome maturation factor RimP [Candidatus Omnitrophota bacterium]
ETQREAIRRLAEPILEAGSAELVELIVHRHGRQMLVRLLVDKVGGVTIQDCARLNQQIGQALEQSNLLNDRYTLEVSSPGLDRPLVSTRDFERAIGEEVSLTVVEPMQGAKPVTGTLLSVQESAVVIITQAGNVTIPFASIQRALKAIHL